MNTENQVKQDFASTLLKRFRQGAQPVQTALVDAQAMQPGMRQRMNELTEESRQWVAEQVQQLSQQARQLQVQSRQLRKALRREAKQRRKLLARMRKSSVKKGRTLLKRGEHLTEDLVERGGKITQDFLGLGGKAAHDLAERSGELAHRLTGRSGKATRDLARHGENLLEPVRKRNRYFWTIIGFSVGLVTAGIVTYRLVRRRVAQQETEQDEHIELPQSESWSGTQSRPAGEIRHLDQGGAVATLQAIDVENTVQTADALYVGVIGTKKYYPIDTALEPQDLVYFVSEEQAQAKGFTAAE